MTARASVTFPLLLLCALAGLLVWGGEVPDHKWANHDVANALYVGERIVDGDRLYIDWKYFVMPPVVLLSAAASGLARGLGLTPPTLIHLLVVLTGALGITVLRRALPQEGLRLAVGCAYLALLAHAGLSPTDFAQREHFFALLFVPYLIWRMAEAPHTSSVTTLLVALGCAAMIKPHFLAAVILVEGFQLRARPLTAWLALLSGAVLPLVALALHSLDSFEALFTQVVPFQLASDPGDRAPSARAFLLGRSNLVLSGLGALFLAAAAACARRRLLPPRAIAAAVSAAVALYLSILLQRGFFPYHQVPYVGVAGVVGVRLLVTLGSRTAGPRGRASVPAAIAVSVLVFAHGVGVLGARLAAGPSPHGRPVLELLESSRLVMLMSTSVEGDLFCYSFDHDLELMRPWTSNYTVQLLLAIEDPAERERAIRSYFEPLALRLREERPDLVLFSPFRQWTRGLTMHDVFVKRYQQFPTPDYRRWKRTANGWVVYRRRDGR